MDARRPLAARAERARGGGAGGGGGESTRSSLGERWRELEGCVAARRRKLARALADSQVLGVLPFDELKQFKKVAKMFKKSRVYSFFFRAC